MQKILVAMFIVSLTVIESQAQCLGLQYRMVERPGPLMKKFLDLLEKEFETSSFWKLCSEQDIEPPPNHENPGAYFDFRHSRDVLSVRFEFPGGRKFVAWLDFTPRKESGIPEFYRVGRFFLPNDENDLGNLAKKVSKEMEARWKSGEGPNATMEIGGEE